MSFVDLIRMEAGWGGLIVMGLLTTLGIAVLSFALGFTIGLASALGQLSNIRPLAAVLTMLSGAGRALPELVVIFLIYFGGSWVFSALLQLFGGEAYVEVNAFWAGVVALGLVQAAYISEILRGAITAVPNELLNSAKSLGLGPTKTLALITLPLAVRIAFPGLCNMWIVAMKNTPYVSAIGLNDLIRTAGTAGENTRQFLFFYTVVALIYLLFSGISLVVQQRIEKSIFRYILN